MKKILGVALLAVMSLLALPAQGQIKFGVKGGVNISSVHFNSDIVKSDNVTGFNIGPMMEIMAPYTGLGFDLALLYAQKGMGLKGEKDIRSEERRVGKEC